jgi:hypothetical protein
MRSRIISVNPEHFERGWAYNEPITVRGKGDLTEGLSDYESTFLLHSWNLGRMKVW